MEPKYVYFTNLTFVLIIKNFSTVLALGQNWERENLYEVG